MADHLTEEEQIEAIKSWWDNNWLSVVVPIVAAALLYTGWNFYSDHQATKAAEASDEYQALLELIEPVGDAALPDDLKAQAGAIAQSIQADYSGTMYADLAALISARIAVQDRNSAEAESVLRGVVSGAKSEALSNVAKARLARVLIDQGKYDEALPLVAASDSDATKALYAELRGDIYFAKGELEKARSDYSLAIESLGMQQFAQRNILQFKLDGLGLPEPQETAEGLTAEETTAE